MINLISLDLRDTWAAAFALRRDQVWSRVQHHSCGRYANTGIRLKLHMHTRFVKGRSIKIWCHMLSQSQRQHGLFNEVDRRLFGAVTHVPCSFTTIQWYLFSAFLIL